MSIAQFFRDRGNATIYGALGEVAVIDGTEHRGVFNARPRTIEFDDGSVAAVDISFDCAYTQQVSRLAEGDPIVIKYASTDAGKRYCFRQRIPAEGDETGRVTLELAR